MKIEKNNLNRNHTHDHASLTRIIDVYNTSYGKQLFNILDDGSAGSIMLGDSAVNIDSYTKNMGLGLTPNTARLRVYQNGISQDIIALNPSGGSGGVYVNATLTYQPYIYFQNSGSVTTVVISSDGNSYLGGGNLGLNTQSPSSQLDISGATGYNQFRMRTSYTPSSSGDTNGNIGDVAWNNSYFYVKTNTGWGRSLLDYNF